MSNGDEDMTLRSKTLKAFALAVALIISLGVSHAQGQAPVQAASLEDGVKVYGQTLRPQDVQFRSSDYTWEDLEGYLPQVLPKSQSASMSAEQFCDHIVLLTNSHASDVEQAQEVLAYKAGQDTSAISDVFSMKPGNALGELQARLPNDAGQIMMTLDRTKQHLALILLHDAALKNCPAYAQEKGYSPLTTYDGPDADYVPEACQVANPPEWCN